MLSKAVVTCSPVETSTSISRGTGRSCTCVGQFDQAIGLAAHGRHHHHHAVAIRAKAGNLVGHLLDALDITDRGATKFLNNETHELRELPSPAQKGALLNTKATKFKQMPAVIRPLQVSQLRATHSGTL